MKKRDRNFGIRLCGSVMCGQGRIFWNQIDSIMKDKKIEKKIEIPKKQGEGHYFFFDFSKEGLTYG